MAAHAELAPGIKSRQAQRPIIMDLLAISGRANTLQVAHAMDMVVEQKLPAEEAVLAAKAATDEVMAELYADHFRLRLLGIEPPSQEVLDRNRTIVPEKFCRENRLFPLEGTETYLVVAMVDPSNVNVLSQLRLMLGRSIIPAVCPLNTVKRTLDRMFGEHDILKAMADEMVIETQGEEEQDTLLDLDEEVESGKESQIIRVVNSLFKGAISDGASDIHLEPTPSEMRVRLRIDGSLHAMSPIPKANSVALVSRIKILSKMDIAEKRLPQDGAIQVNFHGKRVDCRVATVPTVWGEKVVLRILNKESVSLELASLGFTEGQQKAFAAAAEASHGLLFVTGPTGSGKSTTLYATLLLVQSPTKNLVSVEDPVEYKLTGINQTQIKPIVGLDFPRCLRAFLRQDPDVIMVGEVRDGETARICLQAALTGHLVLSTLHTNDALTSIERLKDLGIEPFLLSATLRLVEAQRLVRRLCQGCKEPYEVTKALEEDSGIEAGSVLYRPVGCEVCRRTGYKGRLGVFEVVPISRALAHLMQEKASLHEMLDQARKEGTIFLHEHGIIRATSGVTSLEEVHRVTLTNE